MSIAPPQFIDSSTRKVHTPHLDLVVVTILKAGITLICCLSSRTPLITCHLPRWHSRLLETLLLNGTELEVRLVPLSAEGDTWVKHGQTDASDYDHGALEDHECDFVVCECPVKTLVEFRSAEDGAYEDGHCSDGKAWAVLARHGRGVTVGKTYRRGRPSI
jgi:hypothetical protein